MHVRLLLAAITPSQLESVSTGHNALDLPLTYEGTAEVKLADGTVVETDVYSSPIRFDGHELEAGILLTDAKDTLIGTGLLTGKVLFMNFAIRNVFIHC